MLAQQTNFMASVPPNVCKTHDFDTARFRLGKFIEHQAQAITRMYGVTFEETPCGAPQTYLEILDMYLRARTYGLPFKVDSKFSEDTIYVSPSVNWSFRFWHAWIHATHRLTLSFMDEMKVGLIQLEAVRKEFGERSLEAKLMASETLGQALYHEIHGEFVSDQSTFAEELALTHY